MKKGRRLWPDPREAPSTRSPSIPHYAGNGILRQENSLFQKLAFVARRQSRNKSLIPVLERVCASTVFTITAQYSDGPGVPSGKGLPGSEPDTTTE